MKKYLLLLLIAAASLPAMSQNIEKSPFVWMLYDSWHCKTPIGDIIQTWTSINDSTINGKRCIVTNNNPAKVIELETEVIYAENGKYYYSVQQTGAAPLVFVIENLSKKSFTASNDEATISFRWKGQKAGYKREDKKDKEKKAEKITFRVEEYKLVSGWEV
jgi:hypothetical protein